MMKSRLRPPVVLALHPILALHSILAPNAYYILLLQAIGLIILEDTGYFFLNFKKGKIFMFPEDYGQSGRFAYNFFP